MANGTIAASQLEMLSQSGTGIITITPPATNTNRAITLPDAAGAIVVSGTTPSLNGISFPATQVASADANTLDDYEEGTWSPAIESDNPGTGRVNTVAFANYVKIGKAVYIEFNVTLTTLGSGGSGVWLINGLPFTSPNSGTLNCGRTGPLLANVTTISGITNGARIIVRFQNGAATTYLENAVFATLVTVGTNVAGSCTYFV